ncbi:MAG TPA: hypothetical protein VF018_04255 [Acidobacteriaceae bacterium]
MFSASPGAYLKILRFLIISVLAIASIIFVLLTYRWQLVGDAQVFHFAHFLMANGFRPYRDIPDINMPGTYIIEGWAMSVFGGSDLGWRIYDFSLLGGLTVAMIVIALPYDWVAGFFAGVVFAFAHACEGPRNSAQRDEVITVLIMIGCACLFESLRRRKPWLLLAFGFSLGMACTIKPLVVPLVPALLGLAAWNLKKERAAVAPYVAWAFIGMAAAGMIMVAFLARHHAFGDFLNCVRTLIPFYTAMDRASIWTLLRHVIPRGAAIVLPFALIVTLSGALWRNWERPAIFLCIGFGIFSYFVQDKGYNYHTYPLAAFVLLWAAIELMLALGSAKWTRLAAVGIAGMAAGIFIAIPTYVRRLNAFSRTGGDYTASLESDLMQVGGDRLNRRVQCLDMLDGCFSALYHLQLLPTSGNLGDLLLFFPKDSPVVAEYRNGFWNEIVSNPPSVIVLSDECFNRPPTFDKLKSWPKFNDYLAANYQPIIEREIKTDDRTYRIYMRKDSSMSRVQEAR